MNNADESLALIKLEGALVGFNNLQFVRRRIVPPNTRAILAHNVRLVIGRNNHLIVGVALALMNSKDRQVF